MTHQSPEWPPLNYRNPKMHDAVRFYTYYLFFAESKVLDDQHLKMSSISALGFRIEGNPGYETGDTITLRLPGLGRVEAFMIWKSGERAGFQFERPLRPADFQAVLDIIGYRQFPYT